MKMILKIRKTTPNLLHVIVVQFLVTIAKCSARQVEPQWIKPDMKKVLEKAGIIPDVLDEAPKYELAVRFGDGDNAVVDFGNFLDPDDITDEMSIHMNTTAEHDGYYFFVMTDIDYPSPDSPDRREYIHWIAMNIRGVDLYQGDVLTAYCPPGHNAHGPGVHRYMFYYIKQRTCGPVLDYFDYALPLDKPEHYRRTNFSVNKFRKKWGLPKPTAVNFFRLSWKLAEE